MFRKFAIATSIIAGSVGLSATGVGAGHFDGADGYAIPTSPELGDVNAGYDCVPDVIALVQVFNIGNGAGEFRAEAAGQAASAVVEPGDDVVLYLPWLEEDVPEQVSIEVDGVVEHTTWINIDCEEDVDPVRPGDFTTRQVRPAEFAPVGDTRMHWDFIYNHGG